MASTTLTHGDLVFSELHGRHVRFVAYHDGGLFLEVMDRDTLAVLPDYVHHTQVR